MVPSPFCAEGPVRPPAAGAEPAIGIFCGLRAFGDFEGVRVLSGFLGLF